MPEPAADTASKRDETSVVIRTLAIALFLLIPLQILSEGYFPQDDALRHAAKAVSGRDWNDVLVLRPGTIDASPGWHAVLGVVHRATGATQPTLVLFEVVSLFLLFSLGPLLLLRRPEAWIAAMLAVAIFEPLLAARLVVGRPLVFSMAVVTTLLLVWPRLDGERFPTPAFGAVAALIAGATWIHGSWYLFALLIAAMFIAGRRRAGLRFLAASGVGVIVGALLTGHPIAFIEQTMMHPLLAFGNATVNTSVREFRPYPGAPTLILAVLALVVARRLWRGASARELLRDPVFVLATLGWVLGLMVARFWMDWGLPALVVFVARELESLWPTETTPRRRLGTAAIVAAVCYVAFTANVGTRWSNTPRDPAYRAMLTPAHAGALPDSGGILYADDMRAFYDLFFLVPRAPWRYSTGYEPGLMPPQNLAVYRDAITTQSVAAFEPWARKMTPADRLVIHYDRGVPPLGLEWHSVGFNVWSGRVKR